jgi:DNA-binding PadR family transcriptional regulator
MRGECGGPARHWGWGGEAPGPGHHWRGFGPGKPRGRRGVIRRAILALLRERPMHGYEIIAELERRTGGIWRPSPGAVYPTLSLLVDEGLITSEEYEGRRSYRLTEAGREQAENLDAEPWGPGSGFEGEAGSLRREAFQLAAAARQVAATGTDHQRARALEILSDARRRIYRLLAEET